MAIDTVYLRRIAQLEIQLDKKEKQVSTLRKNLSELLDRTVLLAQNLIDRDEWITDLLQTITLLRVELAKKILVIEGFEETEKTSSEVDWQWNDNYNYIGPKGEIYNGQE